MTFRKLNYTINSRKFQEVNMNFKKYKKYGLLIDTIAAIPVSVGILTLISWFEDLLLLIYFALILLPALFILIEEYFGPIIVKIIYRDEFEKEKEELKLRIEIYKKNPFPIAAGE